MSSAAVYTTSDIEQPLPVQENFVENYDMNDPASAVNHYARIMREHTQKQMQTATNSSRRRTQGGEPVSMPGHGSISSNMSADSDM